MKLNGNDGRTAMKIERDQSGKVCMLMNCVVVRLDTSSTTSDHMLSGVKSHGTKELFHSSDPNGAQSQVSKRTMNSFIIEKYSMIIRRRWVFTFQVTRAITNSIYAI